ncbi:MAG: TetR family transcriptional regulator [Actinophytocola sp.]|nr:TetR family transcriptional regulator [Actinophytocola sp.]
MSEANGPDRTETATGSLIRRAAHSLLVEHGVGGVTLRAIARKLGITAPALYRYYSSHSALLDHLRRDISTDLAAELSEDIAQLPDDDGLAQFFAVCRGFRRWALAHPREFALVFASPTDDAPPAAPLAGATEPFGRVFISSVGRVLANHELAGVSDDVVPAALRQDVATFQAAMLEMLATQQDTPMAEHRLSLGVAYLMVQYWTRIYGHVTLEVFGNFPMPVSQPDVLFNAMLADLAHEVGLGPV